MTDGFLELKNRDDFQRLVDEGLEESLTLDYKASPALAREGKAPDELCKDVSALANSAGGQLIYGIEEGKKGKPTGVDDGVEDPKVTREWIEQILSSRVQPRMLGVRIDRIELSPDRYGYVVTVPPTQTGPHQAPDKKYYRRFELSSVPMADYEIRDVMGRATNPQLVGDFHFAQMRRWEEMKFLPRTEESQPIGLTLSIQNLSNQPAMYAVAAIFIDARLIIHDDGPYEKAGQSHNADRVLQNVLRLKISANRFFPMFKEMPIMIPAMAFRVHSQHFAETHFAIGYELRAPGCFKYETGHIAMAAPKLVIRMPSHALPSGPQEPAV